MARSRSVACDLAEEAGGVDGAMGGLVKERRG